MKNWKSTACGVLGLIAAVAIGAKAILDGDPNTTIDIGSIVAALAVVAPSVVSIFAKFDDKSGGDAGAKK